MKNRSTMPGSTSFSVSRQVMFSALYILLTCELEPVEVASASAAGEDVPSDRKGHPGGSLSFTCLNKLCILGMFFIWFLFGVFVKVIF